MTAVNSPIRDQSSPTIESPMDLAALRRGDAAAIAECYRRHAGGLLTMLHRFIGSREDAEDIVHDVFVELPRAMAQYQEHGRFDAWLARVAVRRAIDQQRRRKWFAPLSAVFERSDDGQSIDRDVIALDRAGNALAKLSPSLRQVVVLRIMLDLTHPEIAKWLGISVQASEVRLHRAIKQLRQQLEHLR
ncbi:MAG: sigma-70 family RNA polymerase sigma factor [Gemmatimonadaceae bacterium]|nr:sigma-70 family RNA polymerase sigma factor [Gemmatimonadaceae bacterium]